MQIPTSGINDSLPLPNLVPKTPNTNGSGATHPTSIPTTFVPFSPPIDVTSPLILKKQHRGFTYSSLSVTSNVLYRSICRANYAGLLAISYGLEIPKLFFVATSILSEYLCKGIYKLPFVEEWVFKSEDSSTSHYYGDYGNNEKSEPTYHWQEWKEPPKPKRKVAEVVEHNGIRSGYENQKGFTCYIATMLQCFNSITSFHAFLDNEKMPLTLTNHRITLMGSIREGKTKADKIEETIIVQENQKTLQLRIEIKALIKKLLVQASTTKSNDGSELPKLVRLISEYHRQKAISDMECIEACKKKWKALHDGVTFVENEMLAKHIENDMFAQGRQCDSSELVVAVLEILQIPDFSITKVYKYTYNADNVLEYLLKVFPDIKIHIAKHELTQNQNETPEHFENRNNLLGALKNILAQNSSLDEFKTFFQRIKDHHISLNGQPKYTLEDPKSYYQFVATMRQILQLDKYRLLPLEQCKHLETSPFELIPMPLQDRDLKLQNLLFKVPEQLENFKKSFEGEEKARVVPNNTQVESIFELNLGENIDEKNIFPFMCFIFNRTANKSRSSTVEKDYREIDVPEIVEIPIHGSTKVAIFELRSSAVHLGSTGESGHYISIFKQQLDSQDEWVYASDSSLKKFVQKEDALAEARNSWVSFYQYVTMIDKAP